MGRSAIKRFRNVPEERFVQDGAKDIFSISGMSAQGVPPERLYTPDTANSENVFYP